MEARTKEQNPATVRPKNITAHATKGAGMHRAVKRAKCEVMGSPPSKSDDKSPAAYRCGPGRSRAATLSRAAAGCGVFAHAIRDDRDHK